MTSAIPKKTIGHQTNGCVRRPTVTIENATRRQMDEGSSTALAHLKRLNKAMKPISKPIVDEKASTIRIMRCGEDTTSEKPNGIATKRTPIITEDKKAKDPTRVRTVHQKRVFSPTFVPSDISPNSK